MAEVTQIGYRKSPQTPKLPLTITRIASFCVHNSQFIIHTSPYPSGYCRQNSYSAIAAAVAALWLEGIP